MTLYLVNKITLDYSNIFGRRGYIKTFFTFIGDYTLIHYDRLDIDLRMSTFETYDDNIVVDSDGQTFVKTRVQIVITLEGNHPKKFGNKCFLNMFKKAERFGNVRIGLETRPIFYRDNFCNDNNVVKQMINIDSLEDSNYIGDIVTTGLKKLGYDTKFYKS